MTTPIYEFEIPDMSKLTLENERGFGPSGELIKFTPAPLNPSVVMGRVVKDYKN